LTLPDPGVLQKYIPHK